MKSILITGSNGFIGKNLLIKLRESKDYNILSFNRRNKLSNLPKLISKVDVVIHLAGVNRPKKIIEFQKSNYNLTRTLCKCIENEYKKNQRSLKIIYTSTTQVDLDNFYGKSKLKAEKILKKLSSYKDINVNIFRLPGVFGKWCKPNYNSVVSTYCYQVSRNIPLTVNNPTKIIKLVYIDDVIEHFLLSIKNSNRKKIYINVNPIYSVSLKKLSLLISSFKSIDTKLKLNNLGYGLSKKLYSTYLSHIPLSQLDYNLNVKADTRGEFVELFKSNKFGQINFFTISAGQIRGGHYHHTKSEKFVVVHGKAKFRFLNIINNRYRELIVSDNIKKIVNTIPGWTHDIINIGKKNLIVLVWTNEIYNQNKPDTIISKI